MGIKRKELINRIELIKTVEHKKYFYVLLLFMDDE